MKTKYDWSGVPKEIKWIATCEDGTVKWFCKPMKTSVGWVVSFSVTGAEPFNGDWQDSLEERPNEN